ncbi:MULTISPECIES: c-type cytochrome [Desulfococcus]|uniref:Cytochrome c class I n=1 Tax=Desulfococcus multivorans DSM 2059 TaxID=1121405 RepID=S7TQM6_DESML|nr:c-type cytochrome [Desulfococcus multivorans]AOY57553.1 NirM: predicted cytochrome b551 [Desulfococcus multivorans]EPR39271.1 cytochrome c class I [Desulfococcus multivorans DSM 2059]SKA11857.1 Cytochrome c [Desulfococcus multivorans DSM 2059]
MKNLVILTILGWVMMGAPAFASDGEELFKAEGCMRCHKADGNSKIYPSLPEIATAYTGKSEQLLQYLNGETEAVMDPDTASLMKPHLEKTKKMNVVERKSVADYIMTFTP